MREDIYYVYVLISHKDSKFYIGYTANLKARIQQHQNGQVISTKDRRPFALMYFEGHANKYDALKRELYFKTTKGKVTLRQMNNNYLQKI